MVFVRDIDGIEEVVVVVAVDAVDMEWFWRTLSSSQENAMSDPVSKKLPVNRQRARLPTSPQMLTSLGVERLSMLGQGYALVKFRAGPPANLAPAGENAANRAASVSRLADAELPEIAPETVVALLKAWSAPVAIEQTQVDNRAVMDLLDKQSMLDRALQAREGLLLSSSALCEARMISRQALSKAILDGRAFRLDGPSGKKLYPAFFARTDSERAAFEQVSRALRDLPGAGKWQFFTTPKLSLGGVTPIEALEAGALDAVLAAARAVSER